MILGKYCAVLLCMLTIGGTAYAQTEGNGDKRGGQQQDTQTKQTEPKSADPRVGGMPIQPQRSDEGLAESKVYEPDCGKPKNQPDADLCVQRRVADAAEGALHWTQIQTVGALVGLALVLATLGVTAWTGKAAAIAAQAAVDAVGAERAWMTFHRFFEESFEEATIFDEVVRNGIMLRLSWINTGRSPAISPQIYMDFAIHDIGKEIPLFSKKQTHDPYVGFPIGSNASSQTHRSYIHGQDFVDFKEYKKSIVMWSRIEYLTVVNNVKYYSEFCGEFMYQGELIDKKTGFVTLNIVFRAAGNQNGVGEVA